MLLSSSFVQVLLVKEGCLKKDVLYGWTARMGPSQIFAVGEEVVLSVAKIPDY